MSSRLEQRGYLRRVVPMHGHGSGMIGKVWCTAVALTTKHGGEMLNSTRLRPTVAAPGLGSDPYRSASHHSGSPG